MINASSDKLRIIILRTVWAPSHAELYFYICSTENLWTMRVVQFYNCMSSELFACEIQYKTFLQTKVLQRAEGNTKLDYEMPTWKLISVVSSMLQALKWPKSFLIKDAEEITDTQIFRPRLNPCDILMAYRFHKLASTLRSCNTSTVIICLSQSLQTETQSNEFA